MNLAERAEMASGNKEFWSGEPGTYPVTVVVGADGQQPLAIVWDPDRFAEQDYAAAAESARAAGYAWVERTDYDGETGLQIDTLTADIGEAH